MISIIIPVLNEAPVIGLALETVLHQLGNYEVIVVDGGSSDATCDIVQNFADADVRSTVARDAPVQGTTPQVQLVKKLPAMSVGIGSQLNLGATQAQGEVLLFLHVDVELPQGAIALIEAALRDRRYVGGGFLAQYDTRSLLLRLSSWRMQMRAQVQRLFSGDTAPFVRREIFWAIGGYPELPIMDDYEFATRLRQAGPLIVLKEHVTISARRHLSRGILRSMVETEIIKGLYWAGVSPTALATFYRGIRHSNASSYGRIDPPSGNQQS
jgi:rSAM/selenodomain-associated transferase 2